MPRVETYQADQVQTQVVAGPRAQNLPGDSFGAPLAQGLASFTSGLEEGKQRMDRAAAEEAAVNFEREKNNLFFNPESGYFNTEGINAVDQAGVINESLEKLKRTYSSTLKSPAAQQAFNSVASRQILTSQRDIARHSSKNLKAWEVATINSQVENTLENATLYWADSERLGVQKALGRQSILEASNMEGVSPEVTQERLENYESSFASAAINAALNSSSTDGKAARDKWEKSLEGPDLLKINKAIEKKEKAERTQQDARVAVLKAGNLVDTYGDESNARTLILEQVNDIEDAGLRKQVMKESMYQYERKKRADSEARAATFEEAENYIMDGGSVEQFKMENPEGWERMTSKQKGTLSSGKAVVTDYVFLSDTLTLPKEKLAQVNPADHFDKLSTADRSKLIGAVKSARSGTPDSQVGRGRTAQTTDAVVQLFGDKKDWSTKKREQANVFYSVIDDEVNFQEQIKGSPLTSKEYTDLLAGMTRKVVKEGTFNVDFAFGFGNSEQDLADIPAEELQVISEFLHNNQIPATAENIMRALEQASK